MFKSISWHAYLLVLSVIAGAYYIIVIAIFYPRDVIALLKGALGQSLGSLQRLPDESLPATSWVQFKTKCREGRL